jgi:hypothetical protein
MAFDPNAFKKEPNLRQRAEKFLGTSIGAFPGGYQSVSLLKEDGGSYSTAPSFDVFPDFIFSPISTYRELLESLYHIEREDMSMRAFQGETMKPHSVFDRFKESKLFPETQIIWKRMQAMDPHSQEAEDLFELYKQKEEILLNQECRLPKLVEILTAISAGGVLPKDYKTTLMEGMDMLDAIAERYSYTRSIDTKKEMLDGLSDIDPLSKEKLDISITTTLEWIELVAPKIKTMAEEARPIVFAINKAQYLE